MKSSLLAKVLIATAALAISLTPGCRRKAVPTTPLPSRTGDSRVANPPVAGFPGAEGAGGLDSGSPIEGTNLGTGGITPNTNIGFTGGPLDRSKFSEDRSQFAANVVYFDFDSAVIKTTEKGKLTAVADYLRSNPNQGVEVEGHCDERGTEEYNRSLGERRALAIREEIALQGIDPNRVFTISYGEDRPAESGHDEFAWSKNRRGEFVLLTPR